MFRGMALCAAVVLLAGCGSGASSYTPAGGAPAQTTTGAPAPAGAGDAKVHLVYFNARGAEAAERKLVERYMKDRPDIEIEYLSTTSMAGPSDTDAIANLIFNIQAKRVVDVAKIEVSRTPLDLMAADATKELTAIGGDAVKTRADSLLNSGYVIVNNGVWALPYEYDPFGYIYNASLFKEVGLDPDKPPQTWAALRTTNDAIKAKMPNAWPQCHPIKNTAKTLPYIWNAGGSLWDRDVLPTKALFTTPAVSAAYKYLGEAAQKQWLNTDEITGDNQLQLMISRKCAAMDISTNFTLSLQANDSKTDWRVAPPPSMNANPNPVTFGGGSALAIPSTVAHPKEALDFMMWLTSDAGQNLKYGVTKDLGLTDDDVFAQATPASKSTSETLKNDTKWKQAILIIPSRPAGVSPAFSKIYDILAAAQERIIRSNANVDEELATAQQQSQQLLDQSIQQYPNLYKTN
ncbi:MAG: extracellular solute-binding protein [Chloroflexi bacterium]|nr:extracellular solute-binding protein [Chloroflexota bacterium]